MLELFAFIVNVYDKLGYKFYGFKTGDFYTKTASGNLYYMLNCLLDTTGIVGTCRRKGLKRKTSKFSNYSGIFTRNLEWVLRNFPETEITEQFLNDYLNELRGIQNSPNAFDFSCVYISFDKNGKVELLPVTINLFDFILLDNYRLAFENLLDEMLDYRSFGDVFGNTNVSENILNRVCSKAVISEFIKPRYTDLQQVYNQILNTIFWYDICTFGMCQYYAERLNEILQKNILRIGFYKMNGELRIMPCTINNTLFEKYTGQTINIGESLGYNSYTSCIKLIDVGANLNDDSGYIKNVKVARISGFEYVDIQSLKDSQIEVKLPNIIIQNAMTELLTNSLDTFTNEELTCIKKSVKCSK